jgi:hypothetical protein
MPARMELSLAVRWMATVMRKAGVSIRRFPDYFASLDRLFWTCRSFDSQLLEDGLGIDSSISIDLEALIDRFPDWDQGIELRTLVVRGLYVGMTQRGDLPWERKFHRVLEIAVNLCTRLNVRADAPSLFQGEGWRYSVSHGEGRKYSAQLSALRSGSVQDFQTFLMIDEDGIVVLGLRRAIVFFRPAT